MLALSCADIEAPGALVPETADEDARLPRTSITLGAKTLWLHVETAGDPERPVVFVLPGGPGADFRLLRPLRELSDAFFMVFWDEHGCGLSQRVSSARELELNTFDDEIAAMQARYAPDRSVTLIGHSFGGSLAVRYAARHPDRVERLILFEPGALSVHARDERTNSWVSASVVQTGFWNNELLSARDHEQADYRLLGLLRASTQGFYCAGRTADEYPIWRFGAYAFELVQRAEAGVDYAQGIESFGGPVSIVAGSCGDLRADFQRRYNLPSLPGAQLIEISGAGHIDLFLNHAAESVDAARRILVGDAP